MTELASLGMSSYRANTSKDKFAKAVYYGFTEWFDSINTRCVKTLLKLAFLCINFKKNRFDF